MRSSELAHMLSMRSLACGADCADIEHRLRPTFVSIWSFACTGPAPALRKSILSDHTSAQDAGRVAQEAGIKTRILSHLVPPDDSEITEQMWIAAAREHFTGEVVVGTDLLEI